jgi:MoaA/NifB/PqqE/SkfB family radical SAM enzyme
MAEIVRDGRSLARSLWLRGLGQWFAGRPELSLDEPVFGESWVEFRFRGPVGQAGLRVEGRKETGGALMRGERLQIVATIAEDSKNLDLLARRILALEDSSLLVDLPQRPGVSGRRLELFIASGCNLSCAFCCESVRIRQRELAPWSFIEERLRRAADEGVGVVQFMGGEASLHPQFPEALALARKLGMRTYTITNLLRWEQASFAEAVAPHLDEVMVSMHAYGNEAGEVVTGRARWWERFQAAVDQAERTLQARVRASTVLSRWSAPELERIGECLLRLRPHAWVMGNAVPFTQTRMDPLAMNLSLSEQRAMRPRLEALSKRCADSNCKLIFFCIPQCILGETLWDQSHDLMLQDQDLSDQASAEETEAHFWSQADYNPGPRPVLLARSRAPICEGCTRKDRCGGYFARYLRENGDSELSAVGP